MSLTHKQRGFTLIELLVVIAIIGILAATVIISLNSARNKAKDSQVKSDVASMMNAIEVYKVDTTTALTATTTGAFAAINDYDPDGNGSLPALNSGTAGGIFEGKVFTHPDLTNDDTSGYAISVGSNSAYKLFGQLISNTSQYFNATDGTSNQGAKPTAY